MLSIKLGLGILFFTILGILLRKLLLGIGMFLETFFVKKWWTKARIEGIQKAQDNLFSHNLQLLERDLISEFNNILIQEELLWFQKSRSRWITEDERNTKYFHLTTIIHRWKAKISMLKNADNVWVENTDLLKDIVRSYFKNLFLGNLSPVSSSLTILILIRIPYFIA